MDNVSPKSAGVTVSHVIDAVRAVAALDDAQRTRLYRAVREAGAPVTRKEAAQQVGISRKLAAFHLDRLVDAGLLEASYDRPADAAARIGRAPKQYRASDVEVEISVPERHYDVVGEILIDALAVSRPDETPTEAVSRVAYERGYTLGADARATRRLGRLGPERATTVLVELLAGLGPRSGRSAKLPVPSARPALAHARVRDEPGPRRGDARRARHIPAHRRARAGEGQMLRHRHRQLRHGVRHHRVSYPGPKPSTRVP
jgi:predicted ArsR family transcriptional regulator